MRLGEALVEAGWVRARDVAKALALQSDFGGRLGTNLLEIGAVSEGELLSVLGRLRRTQTAEGEAFRSVPPEVLRLVPPKLARRFEVVPIRRSGGSLLVAGLDPGDAVAEDELSTITGTLVRTVIGLEIRVRAALERYYRIPQSVRLGALSRRLDGGANGGASGGHEMPRAGGGVSRQASPVPAAALRTAPAAVGERSLDRRRPQPGGRVETVREIELSAEEHASIFGAQRGSSRAVGRGSGKHRASEPTSVDLVADADARLTAIADALAHAEMRDDVADAVLSFCAPDFCRRILLIRRGDQILGWRGEGTGVEQEAVRQVEIDAGRPSLFGNLRENPQLWRGPLPPFPAQASLLGVLGEAPAGCVVAPLAVRGKIIAFLYADNKADGVDKAPVGQLERLAQMAGLALEVALLKNKIRTL